jgi:hypothetical protein
LYAGGRHHGSARMATFVGLRTHGLMPSLSPSQLGEDYWLGCDSSCDAIKRQSDRTSYVSISGRTKSSPTISSTARRRPNPYSRIQSSSSSWSRGSGMVVKQVRQGGHGGFRPPPKTTTILPHYSRPPGLYPTATMAGSAARDWLRRRQGRS